MTEERGSLQDRFQGFGSEPRPEILLALKEKLSKRRRRRVFMWWCFAAAVLTGALWIPIRPLILPVAEPVAVVTPAEQKNSPVAPETIAHGNSPQNTTAPAADPVTKTNPDSRSGNQEAQSSKELPGEPSPKTPAGEPSDYNKTPRSLSASKAETAIGKMGEVGMGTESDPEDGELSRKRIPVRLGSKNRSTRSDKNAVAISRTADRNSGKNPGNPKGEWRKHKPPHSGKSMLRSQDENPEATPIVVMQTPSSNENSDGTRLMESKAEPPRETRDPEISEGRNVGNLSQSPVNKDVTAKVVEKMDSAIKPKGDSGTIVAAETDSVSVKKTTPIQRKWSLSLLSAFRYSALRTVFLNVSPSERRNGYKNQGGAFPSRSSFELGGRLEYRLFNRMGLFFQSLFGFNREDITLETRNFVPGQFKTTVQPNGLVLSPISFQETLEHEADIWYGTSALGLGLLSDNGVPFLRMGAGQQWILDSKIRTRKNGAQFPDEKIEKANSVFFFLGSFSKEFVLPGKGSLCVEPTVQYFLGSTVRFDEGTRIKPVQAGLSLSWRW